MSNKTKTDTKSKTKNNIPKGTCFDLINGTDIAIEKYLDQDPNNIIFIKPDGKSYSCFNRNQLAAMVNDGENLIYPCRFVKQSALHIGLQDICEVEMFDLKKAFIMYSGLVTRDNLIDVVIDDNEERIFQIKQLEPPMKVKSVVGHQFYKGLTDAVSSSHCQPGNDAEVFVILSRSNSYNNISSQIVSKMIESECLIPIDEPLEANTNNYLSSIQMDTDEATNIPTTLESFVENDLLKVGYPKEGSIDVEGIDENYIFSQDTDEDQFDDVTAPWSNTGDRFFVIATKMNSNQQTNLFVLYMPKNKYKASSISKNYKQAYDINKLLPELENMPYTELLSKISNLESLFGVEKVNIHTGIIVGFDYSYEVGEVYPEHDIITSLYYLPFIELYTNKTLTEEQIRNSLMDNSIPALIEVISNEANMTKYYISGINKNPFMSRVSNSLDGITEFAFVTKTNNDTLIRDEPINTNRNSQRAEQLRELELEETSFNEYNGGKKFVKHGGTFTDTNLTDKKCIDLVMADEEIIQDFLSMDTDNIVFKQPGSDNYLCSSRTDLKRIMNDPANIVLPCTGTSLALNITSDMVCGLKLNKLSALGIAYGGYVSLQNLSKVVIDSEESVFEIEDYSSAITVNALAGLRLFPEFRPKEVTVPFYQYEDETNDAYITRLNEWGRQNNQPELGEQWEEFSNLLLGANHCQSGYEGQHIYRIVSKSYPDYQENPRLLKRMAQTNCINMNILPEISDDTPEINWDSEFMYNNTADYTPARNLAGMFANMDNSGQNDDNLSEASTVVNDEDEDDSDEEEDEDELELQSSMDVLLDQYRSFITEQLSGVNGLGNTLGLAITNDLDPGDQYYIYGENKTNYPDFLKTINQGILFRETPGHYNTTFILGAFNPYNLTINYVTNLEGAFTQLTADHNDVLIQNYINFEKTEQLVNTLFEKINQMAIEYNNVQLNTDLASDRVMNSYIVLGTYIISQKEAKAIIINMDDFKNDIENFKADFDDFNSADFEVAWSDFLHTKYYEPIILRSIESNPSLQIFKLKIIERGTTQYMIYALNDEDSWFDGNNLILNVIDFTPETESGQDMDMDMDMDERGASISPINFNNEQALGNSIRREQSQWNLDLTDEDSNIQTPEMTPELPAFSERFNFNPSNLDSQSLPSGSFVNQFQTPPPSVLPTPTFQTPIRQPTPESLPTPSFQTPTREPRRGGKKQTRSKKNKVKRENKNKNKKTRNYRKK